MAYVRCSLPVLPGDLWFKSISIELEIIRNMVVTTTVTIIATFHLSDRFFNSGNIVNKCVTVYGRSFPSV